MRPYVFGLAVAAVALLGFANAGAGQPTPALDEVAIDVSVGGNESNSLGPTESCTTTALAVGATIEVDVVVRGGPADPRFFGFGFHLLFDPAVLRVDRVHTEEEPSLMAGETLFRVIDYDSGDNVNGPPGTTGKTRVDWVQTITHSPPESGDGVLVRVTLTAVGAGSSAVAVRGFVPNEGPVGPPELMWVTEGSAGMPYQIGAVKDGVIVVGAGACPGDAPTTAPTPGQPPGETPVGQTPGPDDTSTPATSTGGTSSGSPTATTVSTQTTAPRITPGT